METAVEKPRRWPRNCGPGWPKEHRFGILLIECLAALRQIERRRAAIEELGRRIEKYRAEAKVELARREADKSSAENEERYTRQTTRSIRKTPIARTCQWPSVAHRVVSSPASSCSKSAPPKPAPFLEKVAASEAINNDLSQRVAGALVELGEMDEARALLESALDNDPENALVHAQLAGIHLRARRFGEAIAAAVESLSLLYFQPGPSRRPGPGTDGNETV